jgi:RecA-family ATPase
MSTFRAYDFEPDEDDEHKASPLPFINMSNWDSKKPPERPWAVLNRIPLRQPTLFSGEGAIGKSLLELHLSAAHVLGRDWLGSLPELGPAIYFGVEDEQDELHRRLAAVVEHYHVTFADLIKGGLHLLSFAGEDALLGVPDRQNRIVPTSLFDRLSEAACDIKPKHIGIDTSADAPAGSADAPAAFSGPARGILVRYHRVAGQPLDRPAAPDQVPMLRRPSPARL